jgi:cysteine-rich repeat protein
VIHHGIDEGSSGITQPDASAVLEIAGLPDTGVVALSDDDVEFVRTTPTTARGEWNFRSNTDGGLIGGLPFPGSFRLTITPVSFREITRWTFLLETDDPAMPEEVMLDMTQPVEIIASEAGSTCRSDCTVPRCGDGLLDAGGICDDGNDQSGDGCDECLPEP